MKIKVFNIEGKETGKEVELPESVFGIEPNEHAIYLAVKQHQANARQGTHKSKQRNEIAGSTKKLKKQKGTGGARAGSIKSPVFRGGGRIFGPVPRDYSFKLNKKVKDLARNSALSLKATNQGLVVIEDINLAAPKVKEFARILSNLGAKDKKSLVLVSKNDTNLYLSSRNLTKSKVSVATDINTYDILNSQVLIIAESSLKNLEEVFTR
jgi:large subunit ribosomal protein L4